MDQTEDAVASGHERAWRFLVVALGLHVLDEALTGFLDFYNPLVEGIRERWAWFPMPTFDFRVWLIGLIFGVTVLWLLTPWVRRGGAGTGVASWFLVVIMTANGLGHLGGSVYFTRWLPGATTAPLLLGTSWLLARRTLDRKPPKGVVPGG